MNVGYALMYPFLIFDLVFISYSVVIFSINETSILTINFIQLKKLEVCIFHRNKITFYKLI